MRFFSNDKPVINISNDSTDLSGRTSSVGVMHIHSVVPSACDDTIFPSINLLNLIEMPSSTGLNNNPDYRGPWIAKQIPNPEYVEDHTIGIFKDIGLIGTDVRRVMSGTIFGDFLITDDVDLARQAADAIVETLKKERTVEQNSTTKKWRKCVRLRLGFAYAEAETPTRKLKG
ncbi:hypothetical protein GJ496_001953 [Pomphorhynchus laevis]|nr:hypothetical protein GJ496_001953 [Pomphorhynchus laevis]